MTQNLIHYKGFDLPASVVSEIKSAEITFRKSDKFRRDFAKQAAGIVGQNIPGATMALAKSMGADSPSTPEGYAKAYWLSEALEIIGHKYPMPNLYIGHYIVCGKAWAAEVRKAEDEGREVGKILIVKKYHDLLETASKNNLPIKWLRGKLSKTSHEDSFFNSVTIAIQDIEAHIINTSYLGVEPLKAGIVNRFARLFVRILRWSIGAEKLSEHELDIFTEVLDVE